MGVESRLLLSLVAAIGGLHWMGKGLLCIVLKHASYCLMNNYGQVAS